MLYAKATKFMLYAKTCIEIKLNMFISGYSLDQAGTRFCAFFVL